MTAHAEDPRTATQADVVDQCMGLRRDEHIGALIRAHGVTMHGLWFDFPDGDVFACHLEEERMEVMDDEDVIRMAVSA